MRKNINWNWIEENRSEVSEMILQGKGAMTIASKFESGKAFLDEIVQISKEIEQQKIQDDYNLELGQVINAKEEEVEAKKIVSENKMNSDVEFISNVFKCTLEEAKALCEMSADAVGKKGSIENLIALKQQNKPLYFYEYKGLKATEYFDEAEENENFYVLSEKKEVETVEMINCTPHEIVVISNEVTTKYATSETVARVSTVQKVVGNINSIEIVETIQGKVEGLPEHKENTFYIVSAIVLSALKGTRVDVIAPDTGNTAIRNDKGQIIAVSRFTK